jgi:uncharacterized membrane protein YfbV (UPF0208 family)
VKMLILMMMRQSWYVNVWCLAIKLILVALQNRLRQASKYAEHSTAFGELVITVENLLFLTYL